MHNIFKIILTLSLFSLSACGAGAKNTNIKETTTFNQPMSLFQTVEEACTVGKASVADIKAKFSQEDKKVASFSDDKKTFCRSLTKYFEQELEQDFAAKATASGLSIDQYIAANQEKLNQELTKVQNMLIKYFKTGVLPQ